MDTSTTALLAIAAILGLNQLVFRLPGWERRRIIFWFVQLLNLATATAVLILGLPGFEDTAADAIKWVLGLLLVFHIVTNNQRLVRALSEATRPPEQDERRSRIKSALAAASTQAEE